MSQMSVSLSLSLSLSFSLSLSLSGLKGRSLYVKNDSVSESVTRSPIELFWTAKKGHSRQGVWSVRKSHSEGKMTFFVFDVYKGRPWI